MPSLPDIKGPDRNKPLCYDPQRDKFIYYDELIEGTEKIVPLETLTHEQRKKLAAERNRAGSDYTAQVLSGAAHTRDEVTEDILAETDFGKMHTEADLSYLSDLLKQIEEAL
jgi:hypothetical protein